MAFLGTNNVKDFIDYIIASEGLGDEKRGLVTQALDVAISAILNRQRWQFAYKKSNFTVTSGTATYDLSSKLSADGYKAQRIVSLDVNNSPPITYKSPSAFNELKNIKTFGETENNGYIEAWTINDRGTDQAVKIEVWRPPDNSSDIIYVLWLRGNTAFVKNFLLESWSHVLVAAVKGCLQVRRKIITPTGAIVEEGALGQPEGYTPYEKAIIEMELNEPIIETLDSTPTDSMFSNLNEFNYSNI